MGKIRVLINFEGYSNICGDDDEYGNNCGSVAYGWSPLAALDVYSRLVKGIQMARRSKRRTKKTRLPSLYNGRAITLFLMGFLLGLALFTYDAGAYLSAKVQKYDEKGIIYDTSQYGQIPSDDRNGNLIGSAGNILAHLVFAGFGIGGFLIPIIMMGCAIGQIVPGWDHMKKHWMTAAVMLMVVSGLGSLHDSILTNVKPTVWSDATAGGLLGDFIGRIFGFFGTFGGTILLGFAYFACIYWFTDRQLFHWLHEWWDEKKEEEFEAYSKNILQKARNVLKGHRPSEDDYLVTTPDNITIRVPDQNESAEGAEDPFLKKAKRGSQKKDKSPATARGNETEQESEKPDWGEFPEPQIRDMSQPAINKENYQEQESEASHEAEEEIIEVLDQNNGDSNGKSSIKPATVDQILNLSKGNEPPPAEEGEDENSSGDGETSEVEDADLSAKPLYRPKQKQLGPVKVATVPKIRGYKLPGMTHLGLAEPSIQNIDMRDELMSNALVMQSTLAQFKIEVKLGDITKGPTITRYELHPAPGIKLEKIAGLNNNIAAALKAERINILAPIPGKSSVGIEVPNQIKSMVMMRELLESEKWKKSKAKIPLALGKDVYGQPIIADLAEMPHLLIAGATGSGKSVCINSIIASLLYKFRPDEMRFVMIDPKVVELQQYNHLPHLVVPVVNDPKKVILALRWVINEMEKRYQIFAKVGVRNIGNFNNRKSKKAPPVNQPELPLENESDDGFAVELDKEISVPRDEEIEIPEKLSYITVIIDELADLMLVAPADVEMAIARITQMARAAGIHCIVATQRPSVDVITGVIKANIPCRIAFQVAAKVDSRTILDAMGADKLLGKGDMLYLPPGSAKLIRAQGALITDEEIQAIVDSINEQGQPTYEMEIHHQLSQKSVSTEPKNGGSDEDEELIEKCIDVIRTEKKASVSLMQRRLRLGYTRAARIMDELEDRGIVGPSKGAEPREILVDLDGAGADGNPIQA